jgi:hypothetical protein
MNRMPEQNKRGSDLHSCHQSLLKNRNCLPCVSYMGRNLMVQTDVGPIKFPQNRRWKKEKQITTHKQIYRDKFLDRTSFQQRKEMGSRNTNGSNLRNIPAFKTRDHEGPHTCRISFKRRSQSYFPEIRAEKVSRNHKIPRYFTFEWEGTGHRLDVSPFSRATPPICATLVRVVRQENRPVKQPVASQLIRFWL